MRDQEGEAIALHETLGIGNWNKGPNRAWKEAKEMNIIKEIDSIDFSKTHGLSWGYYNL